MKEQKRGDHFMKIIRKDASGKYPITSVKYPEDKFLHQFPVRE
jgi:hypothetical protein